MSGLDASSGGISVSPLLSPSRRSKNARSNGWRTIAIFAASTVEASTTRVPSLSRQTRNVARMFRSSSTTRTSIGGSSRCGLRASAVVMDRAKAADGVPRKQRAISWQSLCDAEIIQFNLQCSNHGGLRSASGALADRLVHVSDGHYGYERTDEEPRKSALLFLPRICHAGPESAGEEAEGTGWSRRPQLRDPARETTQGRVVSLLSPNRVFQVQVPVGSQIAFVF